MYSVFLAKNKLVRRLEQGYLQAYLLAKHCSKQFGWVCFTDVQAHRPCLDGQFVTKLF